MTYCTSRVHLQTCLDVHLHVQVLFTILTYKEQLMVIITFNKNGSITTLNIYLTHIYIYNMCKNYRICNSFSLLCYMMIDDKVDESSVILLFA